MCKRCNDTNRCGSVSDQAEQCGLPVGSCGQACRREAAAVAALGTVASATGCPATKAMPCLACLVTGVLHPGFLQTEPICRICRICWLLLIGA